jgi:arylsulfatase A-like enzyme
MILGSDNGPAIQMDSDVKHDGERLGQFRGMKGDVYEGGIHTPWFMRWPAQFGGGGKVDRVAAHIDILPTILDACGAAPPKDVVIDGKSLLPLLRDPAGTWPQRTIFIQWDSNNAPTREACVAAITDEWKLVQPCGMTSTGPIMAEVKKYEKLCREIGFEQRNISNSKPRFELYNIAKDPGERNDLATSHPEIVEDLRRQYNAWFDQIKATARWNKPGN